MLVPGSIPSMVLSLINNVESGIRPEDLRNDYLSVLLTVLEQGGHHAREGERTAVKSVAELGLAIGVLVAELQAVGLIGLEVGDG